MPQAPESRLPKAPRGKAPLVECKTMAEALAALGIDPKTQTPEQMRQRAESAYEGMGFDLDKMPKSDVIKRKFLAGLEQRGIHLDPKAFDEDAMANAVDVPGPQPPIPPEYHTRGDGTNVIAGLLNAKNLEASAAGGEATDEILAHGDGMLGYYHFTVEQENGKESYEQYVSKEKVSAFLTRTNPSTLISHACNKGGFTPKDYESLIDLPPEQRRLKEVIMIPPGYIGMMTRDDGDTFWNRTRYGDSQTPGIAMIDGSAAKKNNAPVGFLHRYTKQADGSWKDEGLYTLDRKINALNGNPLQQLANMTVHPVQETQEDDQILKSGLPWDEKASRLATRLPGTFAAANLEAARSEANAASRAWSWLSDKASSAAGAVGDFFRNSAFGGAVGHLFSAAQPQSTQTPESTGGQWNEKLYFSQFQGRNVGFDLNGKEPMACVENANSPDQLQLIPLKKQEDGSFTGEIGGRSVRIELKDKGVEVTDQGAVPAKDEKQTASTPAATAQAPAKPEEVKKTAQTDTKQATEVVPNKRLATAAVDAAGFLSTTTPIQSLDHDHDFDYGAGDMPMAA